LEISMLKKVDAKEINHAALVGYALSMALFEMLDGGKLRGDAARLALSHLPPKPAADDPPADQQIWRDAEAELKHLAGVP
jgi:hypothetical protein